MTRADAHSVADAVRELAAAEGLARVGFAAVEPLEQEQVWIDGWLDDGMHAEMDWMARSRDARLDPRQLLPGAATVAVLAIPYAHPVPPDPGGLTGRTSRYAWGRDYHNAVGKALRRIQRAVRQRFPDLGSYASVDRGPVFERAWAVRAGIGFQGRGCNTIVPGLGPWVFLATLVLDLALPPSPPLEASCGTCARCLQACPTGALVGPGRLDARRCLSYLTIEHRGSIPESLRPAMGRQVFGCDACLDACPHGHRQAAGADDYQPRPGHAWMDLPALLTEDDESLERRLHGSPLRRARAVGLKRNACVVLGNIGDDDALPVLARAAEHDDPVVRQHARWAAERCTQG